MVRWNVTTLKLDASYDKTREKSLNNKTGKKNCMVRRETDCSTYIKSVFLINTSKNKFTPHTQYMSTHVQHPNIQLSSI